ncbi:putative zinc finger protein [Toxoplasma gondii GAB2-2007-GAL-DOM2]|uniref:Zinc finger protein n=3 Tax=Toxoplasma gondii TaxID=5811 RepID=S7UPS0_TOXGG|nr:hypothetical protein TGGT1_210300 [Toxoplasma gondii GT1]KFG29617.1 putative zinc finger protein [Toxoplasma gondii GAB2-2007-GAL-DOM2]KFG33327.1 putative zinc finger protein [Toxoplasma gondii FOU]
MASNYASLYLRTSSLRVLADTESSEPADSPRAARKMPPTSEVDPPNESVMSACARKQSCRGAAESSRKDARCFKEDEPLFHPGALPVTSGRRKSASECSGAPKTTVSEGETPAKDVTRGKAAKGRGEDDATRRIGDVGHDLEALGKESNVVTSVGRDDGWQPLTGTGESQPSAARIQPSTSAPSISSVFPSGERESEDLPDVNAPGDERLPEHRRPSVGDREALDLGAIEGSYSFDTDKKVQEAGKDDAALCRAGNSDDENNGTSTNCASHEYDNDSSNGFCAGTTTEMMSSPDTNRTTIKDRGTSPGETAYGEDAMRILLNMHADILDRLKQEEQGLTEEVATGYLGQLASGIWNAQRRIPSFGPGKTGRDLEDDGLNKVLVLMHRLDTADTLPSKSLSFSLDAPSPFYESLLATAAYLNDNGSQPPDSSFFAFSPPRPALAPPPPAASSYLLSMSLQDCIALPRASVSLLSSLLLQLDVSQLCAPENRLKRALTMQLLQKFLGVHKIGKCIHSAMVAAVSRQAVCSFGDIDSEWKSVTKYENAHAAKSAVASNTRADTSQTDQLADEENEDVDAFSRKPSDSLTTYFPSSRRASATTKLEDENGRKNPNQSCDANTGESLSHLLLFSAYEEEAIDNLLSRLLGRVPAGSTAPPAAPSPSFYSSFSSLSLSGNNSSPSSLSSLFSDSMSASLTSNAPRLSSSSTQAASCDVGADGSDTFVDRRSSSGCLSPTPPEAAMDRFRASEEPEFSLFLPYMHQCSSTHPAKQQMLETETSAEFALDSEEKGLPLLCGADTSTVSTDRIRGRQEGAAAIHFFGRSDIDRKAPAVKDSGAFQQTETDNTRAASKTADHLLGMYASAGAQWLFPAETPVTGEEVVRGDTRALAGCARTDSAESVGDKPVASRDSHLKTHELQTFSFLHPDKDQALLDDGGEASKRLEETVHLVLGDEGAESASLASLALQGSAVPVDPPRTCLGSGQQAAVLLAEIFGDSRGCRESIASPVDNENASFEIREDGQVAVDKPLAARATGTTARDEEDRRRDLSLNERLRVLFLTSENGSDKLLSHGVCPTVSQRDISRPQQTEATGTHAAVSDIWRTLQGSLTADKQEGLLPDLGALGGTLRSVSASKGTGLAEAQAVRQKLLFLLGGCQRSVTDSAAGHLSTLAPSGLLAFFSQTRGSQQNRKGLWDRSSPVTASVQQQLLRLEAQGPCSASAEGFLRRLRDRMASGTAGSQVGGHDDREDANSGFPTAGNTDQDAVWLTESRAGLPSSATFACSTSGVGSAEESSPCGSAQAGQACGEGGLRAGSPTADVTYSQRNATQRWATQASTNAEDDTWKKNSTPLSAHADSLKSEADVGFAVLGGRVPAGNGTSGTGLKPQEWLQEGGCKGESSRQFDQQSEDPKLETQARKNGKPATRSCCPDKLGTRRAGTQCTRRRTTISSDIAAGVFPIGGEETGDASMSTSGTGTVDQLPGDGGKVSAEGAPEAEPSVSVKLYEANEKAPFSAAAGYLNESRPVKRGSANCGEAANLVNKDGGDLAARCLPQTPSPDASNPSIVAEKQTEILNESGVWESRKERVASSKNPAGGEKTEAEREKEAETCRSSDGSGHINGIGKPKRSSLCGDTAAAGGDKGSRKSRECKLKVAGASGASREPGEEDEESAGKDNTKAEQTDKTKELSDVSANRLRGHLRPACCYFMRSMCEFSSACVFWHPPASENPEKIVCKYGRVCHANHGRQVTDREMASILYDFAKSLSSLADGEMGRAIHYLRASRLYNLVAAAGGGTNGAKGAISENASSSSTGSGGDASAVTVPGDELDEGALAVREGKRKASPISSAGAASSGRSGATSKADQGARESKNSEGTAASGSASGRQLPNQVIDRFFGLADRVQGRDLSAVNTAWRQAYGEHFPYARYGFEKLRHALSGIPGVTLVLQDSNVMVSIDECRLRRSGGTCADAAAASPAPCTTQRASAGSASGPKKMCRDSGARAEQGKSSQPLASKADKTAPDNAWIMVQYSAATTRATRLGNGRRPSGTEGGTPMGSPSTAGNAVTRSQAKSLADGEDKGRSVSEEGKDMETRTQGPGSGKSWGRGARPPEESKRRTTTRCRSTQAGEKSRLPAEELPPLVLKVAREQVVGDLCSASLLCSACGLLLLNPLVHPRCGHMLCRDCLVILSATHFHSVHRINFKNVAPVERRHDAAASPSLAHVTSALLHMFPSPASLPLSAQSPSAPSFCPRCTYGEAAPATNLKEASRLPGASAAAALRANGASSGSGSGGCSSQLLPAHAHLPRMLKPQQTCPLGEFLSAVATEKGVPALLGRVLSKVRVRCSAGKTIQVSGADAIAAQAGESREAKVGVDAWGQPHETEVRKPSDPGFGNGVDGRNRERASVATLRDALCSKHRVATPSEGGCKWDGDYAGYLEHIKRPGECGRLYWGGTDVQTDEPRLAEGGKPPKSSRNGDTRFRH